MKNPNLAGILWNFEDGKIIEISQSFHSIAGLKVIEIGGEWLHWLSEKEQSVLRNNIIKVKNDESYLYDIHLSIPSLSIDGEFICCTESFIASRNKDLEPLTVLTLLFRKTPENFIRRQFQKKNEWLEFVIEGTQVGVWDWNIKFNELQFNAQWGNMLGIPFNELKHELQTWSDLVHPEDYEKAVHDIKAHLKGETAFYENTHRLKHRDGHWVHILDRGKVMERDENGDPIRFTGTHTDISAQKKAEDLAIQLAETKSSFLANMSHEIRSPLNGIIGLLELLNDTELSHEQKEISNVLKDSSDYLQILINDILDLSKIESGKMFLNEENFSIKEMLVSLFKMFEPKAKQKALNFELKHKDIPSTITTDPIRLRQILTNLLSNAFKFTKQGSIIFTASIQNDFICFSVKDSGRGIKDLDKIWEEFEQELDREKYFQKGTGLGLSISRKLTQMMGGNLEAQSDGINGSEFTLKIPVKASKTPPKVTKGAPLDLKNSTYVIIEDHPISQMVFEGYLKGFNAEVRCFTNAEQALKYTANHSYEGIICDINLPGMNGFDFYNKIVASEKVKAQKFFAFTSADVVSNHQMKSAELGVKYFWPKPINKEQIKKDLLGFNSSLVEV